MQYFYRQLDGRTHWFGPYAEGRICLFDAAWAAQLGGVEVEAVAVPNGMSPLAAMEQQRTIAAAVPREMLVGDVAHPIYEPPSEWIMAEESDGLEEREPQVATRRLRPRGVSIRSATLDDVGAMLEIQRRAFVPYLGLYTPHQLQTLHETVEDLRRALISITVYVAEEDGVVRGSVRVVVRNGVAMVLHVSVDPEHAGRGIGTALLDAVEERVRGEAHKLYMEVPLLTPTLRFFIEDGYQPAGVLRRHFGNVDWIAFEKFI
jgi:GNAT superfamily N-acetyltransferase